MEQWIKAIFVPGLLAPTLITAAMAGPFEEGQAAYQRNDYAAALSYWQPLADQGAPMPPVGALYAFGLGVPEGRGKVYRMVRKPQSKGSIATLWSSVAME
jgi:hypothetical protein